MAVYTAHSRSAAYWLVLACLWTTIATSFTACSKTHLSRQQEKITLQKSSFRQLSAWPNDNHLRALESFLNSCQAINKRKPHERFVQKLPQAGYNHDWQRLCRIAQTIPASQLPTLPLLPVATSSSPSTTAARRFWEQNFTPYIVHHQQSSRPRRSDPPHGIVTGYYTIELHGSRQPLPPFIHPIYATPSNQLHRNLTRQAIESGGLTGQKLELLYVDDLARKYFLHVQGSGTVILNTGERLFLSYHRHNGQKYRCINPAITRLDPAAHLGSTENVIKWLNSHPSLAPTAISFDPSYIFFRLSSQPLVKGSQGVPLTPERSVAADHRIYGYGLPIWIETTMPAKHSVRRVKRNYSRLAIIQDRGGAIIGSRRLDLFFGYGKNAERLATNLREAADYYLLLPK